MDFANAVGGLSLQGEANRVFAVAGADRNWFWAQATVVGRRVVLVSPMVPELNRLPTAARAWCVQ